MSTKLFPPYLDQGSKGPAVNFLAWLLRNFFEVENAQGIAYDGDYTRDGEIAKGVRELQRRLGLTGDDVDGNFGPKTRTLMKDAFCIDVDELTNDMFQDETIAVGPK